MARARVLDPATSHDAARRMRDSGASAAQAGQVLQLVKQHPGSTGHELAAHSRELGPGRALTQVQVMRRLGDLHLHSKVTRGPIRRDGISNRPQHTWNPAP